MECPFVSVLIPIRNEVTYIERCLDAILAQDYPMERMEVLIADGMSDDGTRELIAKYSESRSFIQIHDNPGKIVAKGLNMITSLAKGEILIRVDGHCVIAPDYISRCVRHLLEDGVDGVGGSMHSTGEDSVSTVIAMAMSSKFGVGDSSFRTETGKTKLVDTVPFPAYTREIIERVGLYDEELIRDQDDEYNYRIRKAGGKLLLAGDVRSSYFSRGTLKKLWNQYFQYGFYKVRVLQKHPMQMSLRQFVPLIFVLTLFVAIILSVLSDWGWILLSGVMSGYIMANLIISIAIAVREKSKEFWLLPLAFGTIHFSYGLGFLAGLLKYWNRWGDGSARIIK